MSSRESDSDELLRRYSSYGGDTCNPQQLRRLVSMTNSNFGDLPTEPQYYSIPELEMLSSVVASMKSSPSSSMPAIYQFQAEGNGEVVSHDMGNCRPEWQEYWKCEQSIISARASVMVYDDTQKKWVPSGTSSGLSKVQIYHHQQNNTFRVVGRKLHDHEVVINCSILKGLKYNQATATFHQWRDSKVVYGLNFSSQQDAEAFARAMMHALEILSGRLLSGPQIATNGNAYDEDMGYRTMTREDAAILQQQQQMTGTVTPSAQTPTSQSNQNIPQSPPTPQGHHRTSSAPPAPQPPPMSMAPQMYNQQQVVGGGMMQPPQQQPGSQQQSQYHAPQSYQQPIYVTSSSNQSLNQQQPQQGPPQPPPHQNGPIYVASQQQPQGIPSSASSNSVVYASQQSQQQLPHQPPVPPQLQQQQSSQSLSGVYAASNNNGPSHESQYAQIPAAPPMMPSMMAVGGGGGIGNNVPIQSAGGTTGRSQAAPPTSAPQAPPPPPAFGGGPPQAPAPPMQPPMAPPMGGGPLGAAPPPPPPPPMGGLAAKNDSGAMDMSSLAAQLQNARLKRNNKTTPPPAENSGSSTSSGGSGNYGTIGRTSKGMASMMDEMAKTLARRRAQAEKKEPEPANEESVRQRPWEKSNTLPHKLGTGSSGNTTSSNSTNANSNSESPRPIRKRFGSASEETILKQVNGDGLSLALSADLDSFKAEIIREMRLEIQKAKQEIIDAIKSEFNRR
ncbi:unnamed protein product [Hermetia illucens]|uniref:WH1 domain-containing protein n=1 Tax=Hermetia illucens TaxID=343691 RepID=A0A7R8UYF3_HERIL|nr:protein enabled isoform X4 [Hermetia illucens]CAD7089307.1 unnamed protein product [Hermetia illucens]